MSLFPPRIDLQYDLAGRLTQQSRWSDAEGTEIVATSAFSHDGAGRLTVLTHSDGQEGGIIIVYMYDYDLAGQITSKTDHGVSTDYGYDDLKQLTDDGVSEYQFDNNGNRTMAGYDTGDGNQLLTDGTWNYGYDAESNRTAKVNITTTETWSYTFDAGNHLIKVEHRATAEADVDLRVTFVYDVNGLMIAKSVDADGDGEDAAVETRYAIDPRDSDIWASFNDESELQTRYLRGDLIDELFGRISDGDAYWTLTDNQGSVRDVLDQATIILVDTITYSGFGLIVAETNAAYRGDYSWTGRVLVAEIGLQYNRARWYDALTGRWMSNDPLGFGAGDSNLARYGGNNSPNVTDPSGLQGDGGEELLKALREKRSKPERPFQPSRINPATGEPLWMPDSRGNCCYGCHVHFYENLYQNRGNFAPGVFASDLVATALGIADAALEPVRIVADCIRTAGWFIDRDILRKDPGELKLNSYGGRAVLGGKDLGEAIVETELKFLTENAGPAVAGHLLARLFSGKAKPLAGEPVVPGKALTPIQREAVDVAREIRTCREMLDACESKLRYAQKLGLGEKQLQAIDYWDQRIHDLRLVLDALGY